MSDAKDSPETNVNQTADDEEQECKTILKMGLEQVQAKNYSSLECDGADKFITAIKRVVYPEAWQLFDALLAGCGDIKATSNPESPTEEERHQLLCYDIATELLPHLAIGDPEGLFNSAESKGRSCVLYNICKRAVELRLKRNWVREVLMLWPASEKETRLGEYFADRRADFLWLIAECLNEPYDEKRDGDAAGQMWIKRMIFASIAALSTKLALFNNILRDFEKKAMPDAERGFLIEAYIKNWLAMVNFNPASANELPNKIDGRQRSCKIVDILRAFWHSETPMTRLDEAACDAPDFEEFGELPNILITCKGLRTIKDNRKEFEYYDELVDDLTAARAATEAALQKLLERFPGDSIQGALYAKLLAGMKDLEF